MAYSGFAGIGPNKLGCGHKGAPKAPGKKAKPDFLDLDNDGNTTEPMKSAAKNYKKGYYGK